ncbi:MmpS family transport accessory protein, partial [Mycobacterium avium]
MVKRFWIPLVLVVVVALGAYAILRIHGSGGPRAPKPAEGSGITANFNPKHITY